ncbi:hypothetical protein [Stygiolobus caldivivus]|uniref:Uncharacterized protein n=1 Tax=Stygiolobus caldivivus TaxID=2824673 RepID=A0A8D5U6G8_9CREN|nr:hypothetical protein [Stygiolobus caldivivus]BCU70421.1 hypothetical protein KN1_17180 [Stygiolobus caldivivus]
MGRKSCFMSDDAYKEITTYCKNSEKTIYDATNEAILVYTKLMSAGTNLSLFLTEFEFYRLLKSVNALHINLDIPPETLAVNLDAYIRSRSQTQDTVLDTMVNVLNLFSEFLDGKWLAIPSDSGNATAYFFKNEKDAVYFESVVSSLLRSLGKRYTLNLKVERNGAVVRVSQ